MQLSSKYVRFPRSYEHSPGPVLRKPGMQARERCQERRLKDDTAASEAPVVAPPSYEEPVVTRIELWRSYRTYPLDVMHNVPHRSLSVYYNVVSK